MGTACEHYLHCTDSAYMDGFSIRTKTGEKEMEILRKFAEDTSEPIEINTND